MKANYYRCGQIKDLEKRLSCLQEKYKQLTNQLEDQRTNSSSEEGILEYQNIIEERRLIEKYMQKLSSQLSKEEKSTSEELGNDIIGPGRTISLVNNDHKLKAMIVEQIYSEKENSISIDSPIGKAVLGKRVGEHVVVKTPRGEIKYRIALIE